MDPLAEATLSRLDADLLTANLHYAATFWEEHQENFRAMFVHLLDEDTIAKLAKNAASMCLTFNHKIGWVPADYNMEQIYTAYEKCAELATEDKTFLPKFAEAYFATLVAQKDHFDPNKTSTKRNQSDPKNSEELLNLKKAFNNDHCNTAQLDSIAKRLLEESFKKEECRSYFYPQLLLYFLRFFDVYDKSLEGFTVDDYLKKLQKSRETDPKVKSDELMKELGNQVLESFGKKEFWETRYGQLKPSQGEKITYDWYIDWASGLSKIFQEVVEPYQKFKANRGPAPSILHLGCGNSKFSEDLYDEGVSKIIGIDFCKTVIDLMEARREAKGIADMKYEHMDCRGLSFDSNKFDIVLDKGCLDCVVCTPASNQESQQFIELTLCEVARVLKPGGFFVLVSCAFEHQRLDNFFHVAKRFKWKLVTEASMNQNSRFPAKITIYKS